MKLMTRCFWVWLVVSFSYPMEMFAQKPAVPTVMDTIWLKKGGVVLGKLQSAELGILVFDIEGIGDTDIDIKEVVRLDARSRSFQVDITDWPRITGKIVATTVDRRFKLPNVDSAVTFLLDDVVLIKGVDVKFVDQLDGNVGIGFSASTGSSVQLSFQEAASYTTEENYLFEHLSVIMSGSKNDGFDVDRLEGGLGDQLTFDVTWLGLQYFLYQKIPSVGVSSRLTSITGGGYRILHIPSMDLSALSGIALQHETPVGEPSRPLQVEIPILVRYDLGIPEYDTRLSVMPIFYHSLSVSDRNRLDFRLDFYHEVIKDLTVGLYILYNVDTKPLDPSLPKSSTTTTFNVGYEF